MTVKKPMDDLLRWRCEFCDTSWDNVPVKRPVFASIGGRMPVCRECFTNMPITQRLAHYRPWFLKRAALLDPPHPSDWAIFARFLRRAHVRKG